MAKKQRQNRGAVILSRVLLVAVLLVISPVILPTIIFASFSFIPTGIAFFTESSKIKYKWLCVGSLNAAGAMPFLFGMWFGEHTYSEAFELILSIRNIVVIYGASLIGFLIHLIVPPAVASYIQMTNQKRLETLKEALVFLEQKWGKDVVTLTEEQLQEKVTIKK